MERQQRKEDTTLVPRYVTIVIVVVILAIGIIIVTIIIVVSITIDHDHYHDDVDDDDDVGSFGQSGRSGRFVFRRSQGRIYLSFF